MITTTINPTNGITPFAFKGCEFLLLQHKINKMMAIKIEMLRREIFIIVGISMTLWIR